MTHISILNYEEFYLDFLEGNLNTEDTMRFRAFLDANPHIKLENENLPFLKKTAEGLENSFKLELKQNEAYQLDYSVEIITPENQETFIIACCEKLLTPEKQLELDEFIEQDQALIHLRNTYASLHLKPDKKIVFKEKSLLKKKKTISLWPFISIAASGALLLLIWNPLSPMKNEKNISLFEENDTIQQTKQPEKTIQNNVTKNQQKDPHHSNDFNSNLAKEDEGQNIPLISSNKKLLAQQNIPNQNSPRKSDEIYFLKLIPSKEIQYHSKDFTIIERINPIEQSKSSALSKQNYLCDYAMLRFDEMNNPIIPITNRLSAIVNQEVDFRAARATEKRSGGFYLKLGKIKISRRNF